MLLVSLLSLSLLAPFDHGPAGCANIWPLSAKADPNWLASFPLSLSERPRVIKGEGKRGEGEAVL